MIQPFFDYPCNTWYRNLNKNFKNRLQAAQNKCIRFCLEIGVRASVKINEFELINVHFLPYINFMPIMLQVIRMKSFHM